MYFSRLKWNAESGVSVRRAKKQSKHESLELKWRSVKARQLPRELLRPSRRSIETFEAYQTPATMKDDPMVVDTTDNAALRRSPRKPKPLIRMDSYISDSPSRQLSGLKLEPTTPSTASRRRSRAELEADNPEDELDSCLSGPLEPQESPSKKQKAGYAAPEKYAHLEKLTDRLRFGLDGFTPTKLPPSDGPLLPQKFNIGLTDLVERPTSKEKELSEAEKIAAVPPFLEKMAHFRPRIVCFIGLKIAETVRSRAVKEYTKPSRPSSPTKKSGRSKSRDPQVPKPLPPNGGLLFKLAHDDNGPQLIAETLFFAVPSTSGNSAGYQLPDLVPYFAQVKRLVEEIKQGVELDKDIPVVKLPLHDI
ncbi:uracil DNA N-glycosylase Thp1 [Marasmius crinis-equi]|uniref:Uracil DNA N-glycosylase Thp1 n=1 Tax=Marasmius crinis-equi TaxID=585013 RepID=A0ABR3FRN5_9AGAR